MISVSDAKKIIEENTKRLGTKDVLLEQASNQVLAEDIIAPFDIPAYYQSSMDGYAFNFADLAKGNSLQILGESAAGSTALSGLARGTACRVFTGAPLPSGADTVVMQEKVRISDGKIWIDDPNIQQKLNVRAPGAEIKQGETALKKEHNISPASISYLAAIGITTVNVYVLPVVTIIITGNEFQSRGIAPEYGKVYESNSLGLTAALTQTGISDIRVLHTKDTLEATTGVLKEALENSDLVLLTGGVSVGDYDFVVAAAAVCNVVKHFHKVRQKPGKPLFFGTRGSQTVFGLPGNPSSVLTCFYEYVLLAIQSLSGRRISLTNASATLKSSITKPAGLTHFLKAVYSNGEVLALNAQESFRLSSFAKANCLVVLPETVTSAGDGEEVEVHLLP